MTGLVLFASTYAVRLYVYFGGKKEIFSFAGGCERRERERPVAILSVQMRVCVKRVCVFMRETLEGSDRGKKLDGS